MSDVEKYIAERKKTDPEFAEGFEEGYKEFEFGVLLRQAREEAGLTQEQLQVVRSRTVPGPLVSGAADSLLSVDYKDNSKHTHLPS